MMCSLVSKKADIASYKRDVREMHVKPDFGLERQKNSILPDNTKVTRTVACSTYPYSYREDDVLTMSQCLVLW
jgi:hypothetical protein